MLRVTQITIPDKAIQKRLPLLETTECRFFPISAFLMKIASKYKFIQHHVLWKPLRHQENLKMRFLSQPTDVK